MADIAATEDDSEVQWLRARVIELEAERATLFAELRDADTDISDLRVLNDALEGDLNRTGTELRTQILQLTAELAMLRGSMAPHPAADEPGAITHDVPPNAPR